MRLNDILPTSFEFRGRTYDIDLSFDNVLDVYDITSNDSLLDVEKIHLGLILYLGDIELEDHLELWQFIQSELIEKGKRKVVQYDVLGNEMPDMNDEDEEAHFDIKQDADLIYASFRSEYDIDLIEEQGKLHWHKFQALLQGLSSESILQRVIQIRLWKPRKGDSPEYRQSMRKLQDYYRIVTD